MTGQIKGLPEGREALAERASRVALAALVDDGARPPWGRLVVLVAEGDRGLRGSVFTRQEAGDLLGATVRELLNDGPADRVAIIVAHESGLLILWAEPRMRVASPSSMSDASPLEHRDGCSASPSEDWKV